MREEPTATAAAIAPKPSRPAAMRGGGGGGGGEIVEVQGGHIVRSTGRKDRHSKVCTAKGPRDRRVRLSAHTAIQFYDVQDRLGYDRPSKAVDWLIKKAKPAIDELAQLPAWNPTATCSSSLAPLPQQQQDHRQSPVDDPVIASSNRTLPEPEQFTTTSQQQQLGDNNKNSSSGKYKYNSVGSASGSGFLPGSLDTDIVDTIKSFFPTATTSLQNYPQPPDLLSRTASGGGGGSQQDLRLSLQSFQDPAILLQQPHHQQQQQQQQVLFAGTTATLGFDGGWSEQQQQQQDEHEHGRLLHRMVAWSANAAADAGGNSGHGTGFVFGAAGAPAVPVFGGHGQYFSQRGPLQSSNTPSVRAWIDPSMTATAVVADHHNHHHYLLPAVHQAFVSGGGFAASGGGFSGFRIPARIQGGEEHDGVSDKPSSASSDSRL